MLLLSGETRSTASRGGRRGVDQSASPREDGEVFWEEGVNSACRTGALLLQPGLDTLSMKAVSALENAKVFRRHFFMTNNTGILSIQCFVFLPLRFALRCYKSPRMCRGRCVRAPLWSWRSRFGRRLCWCSARHIVMLDLFSSVVLMVQDALSHPVDDFFVGQRIKTSSISSTNVLNENCQGRPGIMRKHGNQSINNLLKTVLLLLWSGS